MEDGVIASSDRSNIMEIGDSTVTFGEATYNSTSGRHMYVSEITDNGINHLAVDIAEKESSFDIRADLGYKKAPNTQKKNSSNTLKIIALKMQRLKILEATLMA